MKEKISKWVWSVIYTIWATAVIGGILWGLYVLIRNIIREMLK